MDSTCFGKDSLVRKSYPNLQKLPIKTTTINDRKVILERIKLYSLLIPFPFLHGSLIRSSTGQEKGDIFTSLQVSSRYLKVIKKSGDEKLFCRLFSHWICARLQNSLENVQFFPHTPEILGVRISLNEVTKKSLHSPWALYSACTFSTQHPTDTERAPSLKLCTGWVCYARNGKEVKFGLSNLVGLNPQLCHCCSVLLGKILNLWGSVSSSVIGDWKYRSAIVVNLTVPDL